MTHQPPEDKIFSKPNNLFEAQIRELFEKRTGEESSSILETLSIILYQNPHNRDTLDLYQVLSLEDFVRLIHLFDGRAVRFPSSQEIRESLILALCFYYKEVKGLDWKEIKEALPFEVSSISYGTKIKSLSTTMKKHLAAILSKGDIK